MEEQLMDKGNNNQVWSPCFNDLGKERPSTLTDAAGTVGTTNTLEDKPKILKDLGPMHNNMNTEGEI